ncbi:MAG: DUF1573 domain-containing protein [Clostridium sp.]|nr:DUF1573 domain-containing protein [Bacteroides sp.]MCM1197770.1 DUF1573 domain-containing protein [Clostridium sp.]
MSFLLNFVLFSMICGGQDKVSPLRFDRTSFDFGTAQEDGGELVHEYHFTNVSNDTVMITQIRTLCSCTRGMASSRLIIPGGKGTIKVTFNPYGYSGRQSKGVTVVTGNNAQDKLTFTVNLIPRKKTVDEEYPVAVGSGLRVDKNDFNFSNLQSGHRKSLSLHFTNVSGETVSLGLATVRESGLLSVSCPEISRPGERGEITLVYDAMEASPGFFTDTLAISVNGNEAVLMVRTSVAVTDDFSSQDADFPKPVMRIGNTYINLGTLSAAAPARNVAYTIRNDGDAPLVIHDVFCPDGMEITLGKGMEIPAGASRGFNVIVNTCHFPEGSLFRTLRILTNDPSAPVKELMIAAKVIK